MRIFFFTFALLSYSVKATTFNSENKSLEFIYNQLNKENKSTEEEFQKKPTSSLKDKREKLVKSYAQANKNSLINLEDQFFKDEVPLTQSSVKRRIKRGSSQKMLPIDQFR